MKLSLALTSLFVGSAAAWSSLTMKAEGVSSRRNIFKGIGAAVVAGVVNPGNSNAYSVPDLPYPFEALEPHIDTPTMKIHHDKHHATYVANINKATEGQEEKPILDLMENALEAGPVRNSGGGHYNHAFFWEEMAPPAEAAKTKPSAQLEELINKSFGSMDEMKAKFEAQAAPGAVFGSGWVWVCVNKKGDELKLVGTPNQDNPLMKGVTDEIMFPILGLDVWEHAYYLKYQNRRPEYVSNWWNVVNWDKVSENCAYVVENHAGVNVQG
ncbi:Superoxide dismutase [Mn] [Seminavis robusta]|uniref:Superoxide dismutase [Fe] n=1 Tax=Seminavis robusta TaxID=568900 RepID=A0A9N8HRX6_9STRA|nr:Superoxide dismutase [Mn] [Seminavis robusta]|eukprot:Sro1116_g242870.1 Superoxide dismutase [Mn] (269) ;mRNA; f:15998-17074